MPAPDESSIPFFSHYLTVPFLEVWDPPTAVCVSALLFLCFSFSCFPMAPGAWVCKFARALPLGIAGRWFPAWATRSWLPSLYQSR